jgi:hypothetical protein
MSFDEIFKRAKQARGHNFDKKHVASQTVESRPLADDSDDNEGSKVSCPECGFTFRIDYAPDPETAETSEDDLEEDQDDDPDSNEFDDRATKLAKALGRAAKKVNAKPDCRRHGSEP